MIIDTNDNPQSRTEFVNALEPVIQITKLTVDQTVSFILHMIRWIYWELEQ
jgi:hypothetical protein